MEIVSGPLTHDQVRTLEAKLIRKRLDEAKAKGIIDGTESIKEQFKKAGLRNKNRGRVKNGWKEDVEIDDHIEVTGETYDIKNKE